MTTADKIMYILQVTDWTQQKLADELKVTQSAISAWRRGRAEVCCISFCLFVRIRIYD